MLFVITSSWFHRCHIYSRRTLWRCECLRLFKKFSVACCCYIMCFVPLSEGISLLILKCKHVKVWLCTLKALALTPLLLRWFLLALKYISLAGSIGSRTSLFSDRFRSSSRVSLEKAPSSILEMLFPVRSILFRVTEDRWSGGHNQTIFHFSLFKNLKASN